MKNEISDYQQLEIGLKSLDRDELYRYFNAYIKYGTNQEHPIDAILDLIKKQKDKK